MGPAGVTQQELESRLWAAANSLRGPVDPSDFKAYIFPLLFYKRISDAWDARARRGRRRLRRGPRRPRSRPTTTASRSPRAATGPTCARCTRTSASRSRTSSTASSRPTPTRSRASSATWPGATRTSCPSTPLLNLIEAFDTLDLRPDAGRPRRPRQRLRVPAEAVRRRVGQEGGRVLHPAVGRPAAHPHPRPAADRHRLRPGLRLGRDARRDRQRGAGGRRRPCARCASTARRSTSPPPPSPA